MKLKTEKKNKRKILVSVIMNCHNGEKYLSKSVKSVLQQTYKDWELIFYDNQSSDKSIKIIRNFKDKRIRILKSKNFVKLYKARNAAIKKSKGEFIAFLDTDDWWHRDRLKNQIKLIKYNKEINLRLSYAIDEMKHYNEYKYVLINDNVKNTVEDIIKIIEYNNLISKNKRLLQSKLNKIINP